MLRLGSDDNVVSTPQPNPFFFLSSYTLIFLLVGTTGSVLFIIIIITSHTGDIATLGNRIDESLYIGKTGIKVDQIIVNFYRDRASSPSL